ncbi:uncharacterized protein LOC117102243 [Anneissia japonica]|uniref:uncharacterized protein LOC117102243 n=1 Tax=Anneissia japonica TaxID=1529436 RepID=UPI001425B48F|nr:uncharacterized protein LOC117102243 [Anneissia japonica]
MDKIDPPKALSLEGNPAENYRWFILRFKLYMKATGKDKKSFLTLIGDDGLRVYNMFTWDQSGEGNKLKKVEEKFKEHCYTSQAFNRYQFFKRQQKDGETINHYVTALKTLAKDCEFENLSESLIRDALVFGVQSYVLCDQMLRVKDLDLKLAIDTCRAAESSKSLLAKVKGDDSESDPGALVHKI